MNRGRWGLCWREVFVSVGGVLNGGMLGEVEVVIDWRKLGR